MMDIAKTTLLRAPRSRVWRAVSDEAEFGKWFGVRIEGRFAPGERVQMVSETGDCSGEEFFVLIDRVEPEHTFSFRWHPGMPRPGIDYASEPTTLVTFRLEDADGGTLLTVTETGFDKITLARRAAVYGENTKGWEEQLVAIAKYVDGD